ncbi:Na+/H+ antiporter [Rhizobium rhizosphaerae]|uniref:Na+/H+ antiporter n=1 Tax=Xaviernesmea rhizosphaerae TaxID=1672749 RepID=A0A1Q9AK34_9HYPH|nr:Na+/H+ antiporter [Xaviernesmea rhizosphaerae]OLP55645.1 Na+/H+ antiporter [Xaviernesmea rhizosphaerae]
MESVGIVLILLLAVVVSSMVVRLLPIGLPAPLVQIALGAALSSVTGSTITLDPEVFFLLFLPPLLFLDGWRIPKEGLFRDKGVILELALGLVVFTVIGVGLFVHWMIPAMPLAVAFALAAILSPTDPIAVSAIAARVPVPKRLMHILEGESLLNDASGLVCMRFAVAAALTGSFSLVEAFATFLWLALGGIALGFCVTWGVMVAKDAASRRLGEEVGSQILISLLIPFAAYLLAEHLGCSGILAAVSAGITMSYVEQRGQVMAATRVRRSIVWDTVQFALNGIIFVILGEQLPSIVAGAAQVVRETGHHDPVWLILYVLAINLALALLRITWVWLSLRLTLYRAARHGQAPPRPHWRLVVATSLAGVRGAITLAGILTLPLLGADGGAFPARDLAILLAAGVIIVSLLAASIGLPPLLHNLELPPETENDRAEDAARIEAAEAALKAIAALQQEAAEQENGEAYAEIGGRLQEIYRRRIEGRSKTGSEAEALRRMEAAERRLRLAAIRAERDALFRASRARRLPDEVARKLIREVDLAEARWGG